MSGCSYDVFISFSRKDQDIAHAIYEGLSNNGVSCFFDRENIQGGEEYQKIIVNGIDNAKVFLIICTPNSMQSAWVRNELAFAKNRQKSIIPIVIDDTQLSGALLLHLGELQYLHVDRRYLEQGLNKLERHLRHLLKQTDGKRTADLPQQEIKCTEPKATPNNDSRKGNTKRLLCGIGITILFIFYTLLVNMSFLNGNYIEGYIMLTPPILIVIGFGFWLKKSRKLHLKLYCETEDNSDSTLTISVDGEVVTTLKGKGFICITEKKGDYLIAIEPDNKEFASEKFVHTFNTQSNGNIKSVILKRASSAPQVVEKSDITRYMCFIAGSTRLVNQRNAVRAVLSILYNKFEKHNLIISSYTFEDFKKHYTVGGQQMQYDEFIKTTANCAIFIVEDGIGEKTLREYRLAMDTFKKTLRRPKVFVYANNLNSTDEYTQAFIEETRKDNCYWREYSDISTLMLKANEDIHSELFDIFVFNNKL